jgi:hypothetical protein
MGVFRPQSIHDPSGHFMRDSVSGSEQELDAFSQEEEAFFDGLLSRVGAPSLPQVSNTIRRGWSSEQLAEYQRQLESVVISLSPDDLPPVVELAKNILNPMIDANRAAGVLAALSAQIREAGGCGDPQCVACSGAATADEPIDGDTTIADLESRADFGEAVEEQGE